jgi:cytochrome c oxidase subunit 2
MPLRSVKPAPGAATRAPLREDCNAVIFVVFRAHPKPARLRERRKSGRPPARGGIDEATMKVWGIRRLAWGALAAALIAHAAVAVEPGYAVPHQIGFQTPVTAVGEYIVWFHNWILMPIITIISLFVAALLFYVMRRFSEKANPIPSKTTHNTMIEVVWTIAPVIILVIIAVPSFRLLTMQLEVPPSDMTLKVTASQWHWNYTYPKDAGGFNFDSYMKEEKDLQPGDLRLLAVDNEAVVPVNKVIRLEVTSTDVIHGFIVQSFGSRVDAVPGRNNETWFKAEREGVYFGQCSKICGKDHAFMPIVFRVVSEDAYKAWLNDAKKKYARAETGVDFAAAEAVKN